MSHVIEDGYRSQEGSVLPSITFQESGITLRRVSSGHRANVRSTHPVPIWGSIFPLDHIAVVSRSAAREADDSEFKLPLKPNHKIAAIAGKPILVPKSVDVYRFGLQIASQDETASKKSVLSPQAKKRSSLDVPIPSATAIRPVKSLLYVATYFSDGPRPYTANNFSDSVVAASRAFERSTFGSVTTFNLTLRMVTLSKTSLEYNSRNSIEAEARTLVTDVDWSSFDHFALFYTSNCCGEERLGLGNLGGVGVWIRSISPVILTHELGHNFGLNHANFLSTPTGWSVDPYTSIEYGNGADWMGKGDIEQTSLGVPHKHRLQTLPDDNIVYPVRTGVYRLYAHDIGVLNDKSKPQGMRPGTTRFFDYAQERMYYVEFRNQSILRGVGLVLYGSGSKTELLNAYPMNPSAFSGVSVEATLPQGASFVDEKSNLMVTNLGANFLDATPYVDLEVHFRTTFAGNGAPTGVVTGPTDVARTASATYTVSASDPDGDALIFTWYLDTAVLDATPTASAVTFVFNELGNRTIRCHINDRKGGLHIAVFQVSVGDASQWGGTVYGTVRDNSGRPIQRAHVWTTSAGGYRGAVTDNAGRFTVSNVGVDPVMVLFNSSTADSSSCEAQFTNPFTTSSGSSLSGLDFVCASLPRVSLSTSVSGPVLNGTSIPFTISRTGDTLKSLAVQVFCDSEIDEAFVGYSVARFVTIPQGAQSVDFVVRHSRSIFQSGRQAALYCFASSSQNYLLTPYYRASVTLAEFTGPDHDNFANARILSGTSASFAGRFNNASTEAFEPSLKTTPVWALCPSVWFRWTAPGTGDLILSWNASYESNVQVYVGNSLTSLLLVSPSPWLLSNPLKVRVQQGLDYKIHFYSCYQPEYNTYSTPVSSEYSLDLQLVNADFAPQVAFPPEENFDLPPIGSGSSAPSAGGSSPSGSTGSSPSGGTNSVPTQNTRGAPSSLVNAGVASTISLLILHLSLGLVLLAL